MASLAATADSDSDSNPSQPNTPVPITVPSPRAHLHHHHHHLLDRRDTPRACTWEPEETLRPWVGEMDGAAKPDAKLVADEARYVLEDVLHVSNYLPDLSTYPNPLQDISAYSVVKQYFVNRDDIVCQKDGPRGNQFRRAGPRRKVYFESDEVHACIVTCGGLCPGLNTVIREIVCDLSDMYGVTKILGIQLSHYVAS